MIDSYGGNLIYHGGNFVGGVEKKDYIEPNVVLLTQMTSAGPYGYDTVRFFTNDTPTVTGEITAYSPIWHSWGAPTVNDCYVFSANSAKVDIDKVWKGSDTPISLYNVSSWAEQTGSYVGQSASFTGISPYYGTDVGVISICFDRSHSASEVKSSGYQLDCSHLRRFAVLKADLGSGSNAVFNNVYTRDYEGCYMIDRMTAINCNGMLGKWNRDNDRIGFPTVIKNTLFSIKDGSLVQGFACFSAVNVSGVGDLSANLLYAVNMENVHNITYSYNYISPTSDYGELFQQEGWWDFPYISYNAKGHVFDSDMIIKHSMYNPLWLPFSAISGSSITADNYEFKLTGCKLNDNFISAVLIQAGGSTPQGYTYFTPFSSCEFKDTTAFDKGLSNGATFYLTSAYTDASGVLRGNWTSARL